MQMQLLSLILEAAVEAGLGQRRVFDNISQTQDQLQQRVAAALTVLLLLEDGLGVSCQRSRRLRGLF